MNRYTHGLEHPWPGRRARDGANPLLVLLAIEVALARLTLETLSERRVSKLVGGCPSRVVPAVVTHLDRTAKPRNCHLRRRIPDRVIVSEKPHAARCWHAHCRGSVRLTLAARSGGRSRHGQGRA